MARKKNAQPKRRLDVTQDSDSSSKRPKPAPTYYFPDRRTTNVIPADPTHPWLASGDKLHKFLKGFQEKLPEIKQVYYYQAFVNKKADGNGWYKGVRMITGNRMEIKIWSELILEDFNFADLWNPVELTRYAQQQAQKDERIFKNFVENQGKVHFSDWSMIVSEDCPAQTIHIDVPANNYQFGLVLQDEIPGTMVLEQHGTTPETPKDLLDTIWKDAPEPLRDCLLNNTTIHNLMQQLLNAYGPLLVPRKELEASMVGGNTGKPIKPQATMERTSADSEPNPTGSGLKCGDLICTAGGIPHAGPACKEFRIVVFAAASPNKESLYDVDEQYYAHSAILFAIQLVWDALSGENGLESKTWLLQKLAKTVQDYVDRVIENHKTTSSVFTTLMHRMAKVCQEQKEATGASGDASNDETQNKPIDESSSNHAIDKAISEFLQENASKTEEALFLYRPNKIWQVA